jgi:hypothetical protein
MDRKVKQGFQAVGVSGREEGIRKGGIWWMCFVFIYENRRMKPVAIVLRREEEGELWRGEFN